MRHTLYTTNTEYLRAYFLGILECKARRLRNHIVQPTHLTQREIEALKHGN